MIIQYICVGLKEENPTVVDSQYENPVTENKTSEAITVVTEMACTNFITTGRESAVESRKASKHGLRIDTCITQTLALPKILSHLTLLHTPLFPKRGTLACGISPEPPLSRRSPTGFFFFYSHLTNHLTKRPTTVTQFLQFLGFFSPLMLLYLSLSTFTLSCNLSW